MDKEMLEMLKKISEKLEKINTTDMKNDVGDIKSIVQNKISEAFNEPAIISIEKDNDGKAETHVEGTSLAILITLAGLEKTIIKKLEVPSSTWELIKSAVGTREAE